MGKPQSEAWSCCREQQYRCLQTEWDAAPTPTCIFKWGKAEGECPSRWIFFHFCTFFFFYKLKVSPFKLIITSLGPAWAHMSNQSHKSQRWKPPFDRCRSPLLPRTRDMRWRPISPARWWELIWHLHRHPALAFPSPLLACHVCNTPGLSLKACSKLGF